MEIVFHNITLLHDITLHTYYISCMLHIMYLSVFACTGIVFCAIKYISVADDPFGRNRLYNNNCNLINQPVS